MDRSKSDELELIIALGSQGTAALGIIRNLMRALRAKGVLSDIEVLAIFDAAAESAEKSPDELGGKYSKSVAEHIRHCQDSALGGGAKIQHH